MADIDDEKTKAAAILTSLNISVPTLAEEMQRLVRAAHLLVDECYARTHAYPTLLLPQGHETLKELLGCPVLPGTAAPGWVLAQARDGVITAAVIGDDHSITYGAHVARFVGGPLDGRLQQFPEAPPVTYRCSILSGDPWINAPGAYRYDRQGRSYDGYWVMVAQGMG